MSKLEQIQALREARVKRNNSRGGGTNRTPANEDGVPVKRRKGLNPAAVPAAKPIADLRAEVANGPRETKPKRKAKVKKPKPAKAPKVKIGRPRVEDRGKTLSDTKPWLTAKPPMSRATWYRRQVKS